MAEKLTTFEVTNWTNFGMYSYVFNGGIADAASDTMHASPCPHKARQYFSISGTVQAAVLNMAIWWDLLSKVGGYGEAVFVVYLRKPDDTLVQLATQSEDASVGNNSGSTYLCDDQDISANLDQVGEYSIEVWCTVTSAWDTPIDDPVYYESLGAFYDPSLQVTERFTKTVLEKIGQSEPADKKMASLGALEGAGLTESYSVIPTGTGTGAKFEKFGVHEFLLAAASVVKGEIAGLAETLTRTYGYRQHDIPGIPFIAGLRESLVARWEEGNVTLVRDITPGPDIWEDIPPAETNWEME